MGQNNANAMTCPTLIFYLPRRYLITWCISALPSQNVAEKNGSLIQEIILLKKYKFGQVELA